MAKTREINLTPDLKALFTQFEREARSRADMILLDLHPAAADNAEAWKEQQAGILRAMQGLLAPLNICAQAATSVTDIERLRTLLADVVKTVQGKADRLEAEIEAACCEECGERLTADEPSLCDKCRDQLDPGWRDGVAKEQGR